MTGKSGSSGNSGEDKGYDKSDSGKRSWSGKSQQSSVLLRFRFRKTYFYIKHLGLMLFIWPEFDEKVMLHLSNKFAGEWHTSGTDVKDLTRTDPINITKKHWLELCDIYLRENFGQFKKNWTTLKFPRHSQRWYKMPNVSTRVPRVKVMNHMSTIWTWANKNLNNYLIEINRWGSNHEIRLI